MREEILNCAIRISAEVAQYEKNMGEMYKFYAYMKACKALREHPARITSGKEALNLVSSRLPLTLTGHTCRFSVTIYLSITINCSITFF